MDNLDINFESSKDIIKKNMISRADSIIDITSKDKNFEYLIEENVSIEEDYLVKDKKKEDNKYYKHNRSNFLLFILFFSFFIYSLLFILFISRNNIGMVISSLIISLFINFIVFFSDSKEDIEKRASPRKLRDLYKKFFIDNIDDYLPLNSEELKQLYNSNEFIKAYVDNNPDEIFTRYSLNNVAGIKMNNLHMINEFKDIIDNKKMLLGLPEGQKIVIENTIKQEQNIL